MRLIALPLSRAAIRHWPTPLGLVRQLRLRAATARALRRQRRALARLDRRLLDDIGLSPSQARIEAARRAWDAPAHWRA